jgi:hypothetical protein
MAILVIEPSPHLAVLLLVLLVLLLVQVFHTIH